MHTNDIALNCCNESYLDSNLLAKEFIESKKNYLSTGISGGTLGARNGLAIMVGGQEKIYQNILPLLKKIAAFKNSKYSVNYFGEMGVGHLVKTLHNYLEYAEMQLITEKIIFLRICLGLSWNDIYKILQKNSTNKILDSYLLQITTGILKKISSDQEFYNSLLPIVDHNNSGLWGLNTSIETASFTPTLQISVMNRIWLNNFSSSNSKKKVMQTYKIKNISNYLKLLNQTFYFSRLSLLMQFADLIHDIRVSNKININLAMLQKNWSHGAIVSSTLISNLVFISKNKSKLRVNKNMKEIIRKNFAEVFKLSNQFSCPLLSIYSSYIYFSYNSTRETNSKIIALQRNKFGDHPLAQMSNASFKKK